MIIGTITLLSILLFGGGGLDLIEQFEKMEDKVEKVVTDEARAVQAEAAIDALVEQLVDLAVVLDAEWEAVLTLDLRHDVTEAEYRTEFEGLMEAWKKHDDRMIEHWSTLRELTTREEWDALHEDLAKKVDKLTEQRLKAETG